MLYQHLSPPQSYRLSYPHTSKLTTIKKLQSNVITFPYLNYPFPNHRIDANSFKTIIKCGINQQKMNKLASFQCQNVIALKKIVKVKMNDQKTQFNLTLSQSQNQNSTYSFYYEKVLYSLSYVLESKSLINRQNQLRINLNKFQIKKNLARTIAYLLKQGIIYFIEFSNIGLNQKGTVKIYVSPNVLFDQSQYNQKTKVLVIKYLNDVLKQIDRKFSLINKPKQLKKQQNYDQPSIQYQILKKQDSFLIDQDQKFKNSPQKPRPNQNLFLKQQQSFTEEEQNFIGASGSTKLDSLKLQNILKKRLQNNKFINNAQINFKTQKQNKINLKVQQKKKISQISQQLQEIRHKIRQKARERKQKQLYITKGFRTMATETKTLQNELDKGFQAYKKHLKQQQKKPSVYLKVPKKIFDQKRKRKSSQSSVNLYQGLLPYHKNVNCINIYHQQNNYNHSYYVDDALSVDTYQMEIGEDYKMPKIAKQGSIRNTLLPSQTRQSLINLLKVRQRSNSHSRFSETMGGKRFNEIVNMIKQPLKQTKQNIQEQFEFQNQQNEKYSNQLKKSIHSKLSTSKSQKEQKQARIKLSTSQSNLQQLKQLTSVANQQFNNSVSRNESNKHNNNKMVPFFSTSNLRFKPSYYQTNQPKQTKKSQNISVDKISELLHYKTVLNLKVKQAMEKTKNAINILNKIKCMEEKSVFYLQTSKQKQ